MSSTRIAALALLVAVLFVGSQAQTTYVYNFDSIRRHIPSYNLGYILSGYTVMLNLTTQGSATNFNSATFTFQPDLLTGLPIAPTTTTCASSPYNCIITYDVSTSQNYRLNITVPSTPSTTAGLSPNQMQIFQMTVSSYLTSSAGPSNSSASISTLLKISDTFRDRVSKLLYFDSSQKGTFTLYPAEGTGAVPDTSKVSLHLYPVANILNGSTTYSITGATDVLAVGATATFSSSTKTLTYTSNAATPLASGFYVLVISYDTTNVNFIRATFTSNSYACPFNPDFPDFYSNFQPCTTSSATNQQTPGFPCLNFDSVKRVCTVCASNYELKDGLCVYSTTCGPNEYFKFGNCIPVPSDCKTFDRFTGQCLTCNVPGSRIVDGKCVVPEVVCTDRQYKVNNTCVDASALCKTFNGTGACTSCYDKFEVKNGTCVPIVVICGPRQYIKDNVCVNIPEKCPNFNTTTEKCISCDRGYYVNNGVCQKIECPPGQVPSVYGVFCINVSPLCDNYDTLTGDCLSCKQKDQIISNGQCIQTTSPLAGCAQRQALGYGPCVDAEVNCQNYNIQTGNCDECQPNFFKDFTGRCTLENKPCQSDEISIQGICVQKPANCDKVDNLGLCSRCMGLNYRIINGQCVLEVTCAANQYLSGNNECVDVAPGCSAFNPSTGTCFTCSNGAPANNGLCCPDGFTVLGGECVSPVQYQSIISSAESSDVPTCIATHPSLGTCLQCNGNFQVDLSTGTTCF